VNTISQSLLSTNFVQVPVSIKSPAGYDPTGDAVAMAFTLQAYPVTEPGSGDWHAGSWVTFPGPVYWAQCLVGPANGGVPLAAGTWLGWVRVTDSPAVPVDQSFILQITP
jgi:hypothetical protein